MSEEILVTFDAEGNPSVTVKGVKGKSCKELTAALEKALGSVTEDKHTPEFNMQPEVRANVIRR
jgi:hypothetical protein